MNIKYPGNTAVKYSQDDSNRSNVHSDIIEKNFVDVDINACLENIINLLDNQIKKKTISIYINIPSNTHVYDDEHMVSVIFRNFI